MTRFGMFAKVTAKAGHRDEVAQLLLQAAREPMPGCEVYAVNTSPQEPDVVCVYEVWKSPEDHDASLTMESVKALIAKTKPLVAGFEGTRLDLLGGKGV